MGASIYFKLNSPYNPSSSIFGIIFGGFIKGIEKDGRSNIYSNVFYPLADFIKDRLSGIAILIGSNY